MERFTFTVDSALLGELGERLVSTVHVALTELVKNGYDADATVVDVKIIPEEGKASRVVVSDNGEGMTVEQVRDFWMKIGTSNKVASPVSEKFGRLKTGSKGIGRFACRRLGTHLKLTTTAGVSSKSRGKRFQTTTIEFDWLKFKPGTDVEGIECQGLTRTSDSGKSGTELEIWGGESDEWRASGIDYVMRQLVGLASNRGAERKGFSRDPGFNVRLEAPGFTGKIVDLREEVIDASWGTLTAEVDARGRAHCQLNAKGLRGTQTYVSKPKFKAVAGAKLRLGILPVQKDEARKPQILSKYTVKEIVTDWGGVQVRYNGFRMFPYGDVRDDWLGIDRDRGRRLGKPDDDELFNFAKTRDRIEPSRFLLAMLSMRSYIGQVSVSSQINGLSPRIDRQGFVENPAFRSLRDFARFAIDWSTVYRDYYIRLREHEEAERAREEIAPVLNLKTPGEQLVPKAASYLRREIKRIVRRLPPSQQKVAEKTLIQTVHAIETTSETNRKQLEHLRLVASASTLTLLFAHEIRTILGILGATATRLDQLAHQLGARHTKELSDVATGLRDSRDRFEGLISITGLVGAFKREDRLDDFHLKTAVDRAVQCFDLVKDNYKITISTEEVATELKVGPMIEGELYTVLLNLLSNSVKSVIAAAPRKPLIAVRGVQEDRNIKLSVLDNGIGLDRQFYDQVFTPFISDPSGQLYDRLQKHANPEDMHIFGTGSGLGLSIARDVLRSRGGSIRFVEPPESWNTCVEVTFP